MATVRRETRRINRNRLMKFYAYLILAVLILIGFLIGRFTAPEKIKTVAAPEKIKTVTVSEIVEVPIDNLPKLTDIKFYDIPLSHSLQRYIFEICADENVPPTLVLALIEQESDFNPEAVSKTDDYGLMQINVINHEQLNESYRTADMLNPYQNVFCGVKILGAYISRYENLSKALMAYNLGEYGAKKLWEQDITTTTYTDKILELMQGYEQETIK